MTEAKTWRDRWIGKGKTKPVAVTPPPAPPVTPAPRPFEDGTFAPKPKDDAGVKTDEADSSK